MHLHSILAKLSTTSTHVVYFHRFGTPIGEVIAAADDDYLYISIFEDTSDLEKKFENVTKKLNCKYVKKKNKLLEDLEAEFSKFLQGYIKKFTVPIKFFGSEFQNAVWNKMLEIPYGSTKTYTDLAIAIGQTKKHSRAVGGACGANPLVVVVPCHRLVGVCNKGGYSSGRTRKDKLLQLEEAFLNHTLTELNDE